MVKAGTFKRGGNSISKYQSKNHFKYLIKYHIIFVCKYRKKLLRGKIDDDMKQILYDISYSDSRFSIDVMESDKDHIHLMVNAAHDISALQLAKKLKGKSTIEIWKLNPQLRSYFWKEHTFWSDGTFVCTIGNASMETICKYIEQQGKC